LRQRPQCGPVSGSLVKFSAFVSICLKMLRKRPVYLLEMVPSRALLTLQCIGEAIFPHPRQYEPADGLQ